MTEPIEQFNRVYKFFTILGDLLILNAIFIALYFALGTEVLGAKFSNSLIELLIISNLVYLTCNYAHGVILYRRFVRVDLIVQKALRNTFLHALVFIAILAFGNFGHLSVRFFVLFYTLFLICLIIYRLTLRYLLKKYRQRGGNACSVILVGDRENMIELHKEMTDNPTSGFNVIGYFAEKDSGSYPESLPCLGREDEVISYLENHPVEQVYCGLSSSRSDVIIPIINYCENHMVRFFHVPNIRNYLKRRMHFELRGNVPIMYIRQEPLSQLENRILKRVFDFFFSLTFLCTLFPFLYICIAIAIKTTSPGPIFFKQRRTGKGGKEFWCYKFRSMHVNAECDTLQATKNDTRKTGVGNFLRRTNLDELPQFFNVLRGDMSVVGPRPHMLKHTKEYSELIDKYMVRHLVKPGITGWAQINGFRGETKELWQMEGRVLKDIWYLEHWTFLLDMYIIYRTIKNLIKGEKEAY